MSIELLYAGANDNLLQLAGLKNGLDNSVANGATVTVTLKDWTGTNVPGISWPATMSATGDNDGSYHVQLPASLGLIAGKYYSLVIVADYNGMQATWHKYIKAVARP